jgi:hypothetical protein
MKNSLRPENEIPMLDSPMARESVSDAAHQMSFLGSSLGTLTLPEIQKVD